MWKGHDGRKNSTEISEAAANVKKAPRHKIQDQKKINEKGGPGGGRQAGGSPARFRKGGTTVFVKAKTHAMGLG